MARFFITPKNPNVKPFSIEGDYTSKCVDGELIYYIGGGSYPEEIAQLLDDDETLAALEKKYYRLLCKYADKCDWCDELEQYISQLNGASYGLL